MANHYGLREGENRIDWALFARIGGAIRFRVV
jgi:hypothetical protein